MHSCLYEGWVRHTRTAPFRHDFRYGLYLCYLDLAELPGLFDGRWLWSARRPALAWFRRADYLGRADQPLEAAVRDLVEERTGRRPPGRIGLLTHLRTFGYCFNPVSLYYCFDAANVSVESVVAEVTNTPWKQRHCYVLPLAGARPNAPLRTPKEFHVSPFMGMDLEYEWRLTPPGDRLRVLIVSRRHGRAFFSAELSLARHEITGANLARALLRHPFVTGKVIAAIHYEALRLRRRGAPHHPHPSLETPQRERIGPAHSH